MGDIAKGEFIRYFLDFARGEVTCVEQASSDYETTIRHQFDCVCLLALDGEAANYFKHLDYRRKHEVNFSEMSEQEMNMLYTTDEYGIENYYFQVLGYDIEVKDALIAEALQMLTEKKRNVILLSYFLEMNDAEIARSMKLVRSTVHEHRKRSIEILKQIVKEYTDEKRE